MRTPRWTRMIVDYTWLKRSDELKKKIDQMNWNANLYLNRHFATAPLSTGRTVEEALYEPEDT